MIERIRDLLGQASLEQRRQIFQELRDSLGPHPFERRMNAKSEVILEALERASDLTLRGVRGIIGEATFVREVAPTFVRWKDITPSGDYAYDAVLRDEHGDVRVQCKMQRREKGAPLIKNGFAIVEVQRTRTGQKNGAATRPYKVGEFDLLAVCMEASSGRWNSFMYAPEPWLFRRPEDSGLLKIMQPVSLKPGEVWTDDFDEAVRRLRSGRSRPTNETETILKRPRRSPAARKT